MIGPIGTRVFRPPLHFIFWVFFLPVGYPAPQAFPTPTVSFPTNTAPTVVTAPTPQFNVPTEKPAGRVSIPTPAPVPTISPPTFYPTKPPTLAPVPAATTFPTTEPPDATVSPTMINEPTIQPSTSSPTYLSSLSESSGQWSVTSVVLVSLFSTLGFIAFLLLALWLYHYTPWIKQAFGVESDAASHEKAPLVKDRSADQLKKKKRRKKRNEGV